VCSVLHAGLRNVAHGAAVVSELGSHVHAEGSGSHTESVSLGSVFPSVADLAVEVTIVFGDVHAVKHLVAQIAFEAELVPFGAAGYSLLGCVDGLAALAAFGSFRCYERHVCGGGGSLGILEITEKLHDARKSERERGMREDNEDNGPET